MTQQRQPFRYEVASGPSGSRALDRHIGGRIRARRHLLGWSRERLGNALDIAAARVRRYEDGLDHVAAGRFFDLAQALGVPVSFFFDDTLDTSTAALPDGSATQRAELRRQHPAAANDGGPAASPPGGSRG